MGLILIISSKGKCRLIKGKSFSGLSAGMDGKIPGNEMYMQPPVAGEAERGPCIMMKIISVGIRGIEEQQLLPVHAVICRGISEELTWYSARALQALFLHAFGDDGPVRVMGRGHPSSAKNAVEFQFQHTQDCLLDNAPAHL